MDRYWLLTWTTYGTWLPGDRRGFVGPVRTADRLCENANEPTRPYHSGNGKLAAFAHSQLQHPPILLIDAQARLLLAQFQETATYRGWALLAVAVMANHTHLVVGVAGDPDPSTLLRDFKAYGSRALNKISAMTGLTWWTEHGSTRKLPDERAVFNAVRDVRRQESPLVVWCDGEWFQARLPGALLLNDENTITGGTYVPPLAGENP